eukprot:2122605-Rhodomonas_salina.2
MMNVGHVTTALVAPDTYFTCPLAPAPDPAPSTTFVADTVFCRLPELSTSAEPSQSAARYRAEGAPSALMSCIVYGG